MTHVHIAAYGLNRQAGLRSEFALLTVARNEGHLYGTIRKEEAISLQRLREAAE